jgi:hypothetical protein
MSSEKEMDPRVPQPQREARESLPDETRREREGRFQSSGSEMHPPRATVVHGDPLPAEALSPEEASQPKGPVGTRQEVGSKASSQRHPPHVTVNDEGAPVQQSTTSDDDVPALPANAHGKDSIPADEASRPIDRESMYGARPTESLSESPPDNQP